MQQPPPWSLNRLRHHEFRIAAASKPLDAAVIIAASVASAASALSSAVLATAVASSSLPHQRLLSCLFRIIGRFHIICRLSRHPMDLLMGAITPSIPDLFCRPAACAGGLCHAIAIAAIMAIAMHFPKIDLMLSVLPSLPTFGEQILVVPKLYTVKSAENHSSMRGVTPHQVPGTTPFRCLPARDSPV